MGDSPRGLSVPSQSADGLVICEQSTRQIPEERGEEEAALPLRWQSRLSIALLGFVRACPQLDFQTALLRIKPGRAKVQLA